MVEQHDGTSRDTDGRITRREAFFLGGIFVASSVVASWGGKELSDTPNHPLNQKLGKLDERISKMSEGTEEIKNPNNPRLWQLNRLAGERSKVQEEITRRDLPKYFAAAGGFVVAYASFVTLIRSVLGIPRSNLS